MYGDRRLRTVRRAVSTRTHIYSAGPLKLALELGHVTFEELPIQFQVRGEHRAGAEHWFDSVRSWTRSWRAPPSRGCRHARPATSTTSAAS